MGGAINFGVQHITVDDTNDTHSTIIDLIVDNVDTDSWNQNGGKATITAVNDTLLIRQTDANHKKVGSFLKDLTESSVGGQPLTLDVWWIPANAGTKRNLAGTLAEQQNTSDAIKALNELSESVGGYHGSLQCRNRVTGNLVTGHRMPVVVGSVPVVGHNASEHQPIVETCNIGLSLEVTPRIQEQWNGSGIRMELRTELTTLAEPSKPARSAGEIDRYTIGSHALETNTLCQSGVPVVAGGLTAVGLFPGDEEDREMITVLLVQQ
jgi:hypothetical protein